jgi:glutamyl-Q tRNA(Asp) synthetase
LTPPPKPTFRFAPSPNGALHLGHALSALVGHDWARALGGRFLVRIEDIDVARTREEHVAGILDDLDWLGVASDEPPLRQSEHLADYASAAARLIAEGLLYPSFATRGEIVAASGGRTDPDGAALCLGLDRDLAPAEVARRHAAGEPFALRLHMHRALARMRELLNGAPLTFREEGPDGRGCTTVADPAHWGDVVIVRKDAPASYHLACVVDDARQGITHVTRGADLFAATDLQRLLQILLGLPAPAVYHHHRLITGPDDRKLSKSAGDTGLATLRAGGAAPDDIRRAVGLAPRPAVAGVPQPHSN